MTSSVVELYALTLLTLNPTSNGSLSVSFNGTSKYDIIQNSTVENVALVRIGHLPIQIRGWHLLSQLSLQGKPAVIENAVQVY